MKIALSLALATLFFVGCGDDSAKETHHEVKKEVTHKAPAHSEVTHKVEEVKKEVVAVQKTGTQLYVACAGCHGQHAEKKALGKSQVIKGWDASKVEHALNGYKDGSYGASMKAIMKGQASKLSDADTKAVAEYISKM